ncbi:MAG: hypothetical protein ABIN24_13625, partial [Dyadobacter sp.]
TTARKRQEWTATVAPSVISTLNQIIETADLQNFAHVIQTEGTDGNIIYLNLLHIERPAAKILDSSDKENLKIGRQLAFKPLQSGDIGIYSCQHENGEYVADFKASHEPLTLNDDTLIFRYFNDFLDWVMN